MLPATGVPTLGETLLTTGLGTLLGVVPSLGDKLDPVLGEVDNADASEGLAVVLTTAVLMLGVTGFHPTLIRGLVEL